MFTGIIEAVGQVKKTQISGGRMLLTVDVAAIADGTSIGDSIAVNGVCLTVSSLRQSTAEFDVSGETLQKSTLSRLKTGSKVNLERAMSAQGRFGGHIVQGHVDGTAKIAGIRKEAGFAEFRFEPLPELMTQIILKGSIAIDGISLTVSKIDKSGFNVALIPTTLSQTTWHAAQIGDRVNIETDILIKIVQKQLAALVPEDGLTLDKLRQHGF